MKFSLPLVWKLSFIGLLLVFTSLTFGQINMEDSTVQIIGYWDINESESYTITYEKLKVKDLDTTSTLFVKYDVDITIIDSSADSYTISWAYYNYKIKTENKIMEKILSAVEEITLVIKTNELGEFIEVVNWKEVQKIMLKAFSLAKKEFSIIPNIDQFFKQTENTYSSKEAIETASIKEIRQFYYYHGRGYKFGETLSGSIKSPNLYSGEPFDTDVKVWIEEIDPEENYTMLITTESANPEQLKKATIEYLDKMISTMNNAESPKWDDFSDIKHTTTTTSWIHGYGWILYSLQTKEVSVLNTISIERSTIEIK